MTKEIILSKLLEIGNQTDIPPKSSAVIIPLIEVDGQMHILFEQRSLKLEFQPGDVCFPGGRIEDGETPRQAAIREFIEELLPDCRIQNDKDTIESLEIISALTPLMGPTGALVYPFVALVKEYNWSFSSDEVERVFTYPVSYFYEHMPKRYPMEKRTIAPEDFPYEKVTGGRSTYDFHVQKYDMWVYEDTEPVIWGFTGRLLHYFMENI